MPKTSVYCPQHTTLQILIFGHWHIPYPQDPILTSTNTTPPFLLYIPNTYTHVNGKAKIWQPQNTF